MDGIAIAQNATRKKKKKTDLPNANKEIRPRQKDKKKKKIKRKKIEEIVSAMPKDLKWSRGMAFRAARIRRCWLPMVFSLKCCSTLELFICGPRDVYVCFLCC